MNAPALKFHLLKVGHCSHPECIAMRGGHWRSVMFPALCALIGHPSRGWMLYDTGYSEHFMAATRPMPERLYRWTTPFTLPPEETLAAQLHALCITPGDIRHVLISHLHGDHIAGIKDFPNARFIAMRAEYESMRHRSRIGGLMHAFLPALLPGDFERRLDFAEDAGEASLPPEFRPFTSGFDLFGDASVIGVPLPGHSKGQMGIALRRARGDFVFMVADACWSTRALQNGQRPTWLASRIFDSGAGYAGTFRQLQQLAGLPQAPLLIPSHCMQAWKNYGDEPA